MTNQPENDAEEFRQARFTPPPGSTELLLVRHGESAPARRGHTFPLVDGLSDPDLAPEGREQAERVADRLCVAKIDHVYVTPLRRTSQTAAPLVERLGMTPKVEPGLREVYLGEWEGGLFRQKVAENGETAKRLWTEQRWDVIPGAEPAEEFAARVREAIERLAAAHPDETVAVFTHGGVIGQALAHAARSRPFAFVGADNASISHLVITPEVWILRRFNDTAHLDPAFSLVPTPLT
ncbi:MAG TPA: histidine phosphatase family protein [Actinophytocola sp.]|uniref:histidine phosphatase family protein n=1 Tax=Actinophytocola sp. TaxID=1872138 RepID=UPI002DDCAED8|nr:histidine phosphatase family protein [Actinophytocola sp.]HEV2784082.1 histidine phosphatase family protein [Actinophytocola sp.]